MRFGDVGEHPGGQHQVADPDALVGTVETGIEAGEGAAEGHTAGDLVDVGAAAGGQALALQAGVLLVALQQGLDEGAVGGGVVGSVLGTLKGEALGLKGGTGHVEAVLLGGAQGHTGVHLAVQAGGGDLQQGEDGGELAGDGILLGNAHALAVAVAVGEQLVESVQAVLAGTLGQRQGAQQGDQTGDGVVAALGIGGVGAGTLGGDDGGTVFGGEGKGDAGVGGDTAGDGLDLINGQTLDGSGGIAGQDVDADAAVEPLDAGQSLLHRPIGGEAGLHAALLGVDHGEAGVGGEGGGGKGMAGEVPGDVAGAGLLIGAQNAAAVLGQGDAHVLHGLHGQQGGHQGALVVIGAAAVDQVADDLGGVGLGDGPAVAGEHHVQMAQNVQSVLAVVQVGGAHIAFMVGGDETPFSGQLQSFVQSGGGAGAEGSAGSGFALGALNGDQTADGVHQHLLLVFKISFNSFLVHGEDSPLLKKRGQSRSSVPLV